MKKIFFIFGLTFNFCIFAQALDASSLAKVWVQNRFPACQNPESAAKLITEFSKDTLAGLIGKGNQCAEQDLNCFRAVDTILDSNMRKYFLRVSVRCAMSKINFNAAYMEATQKGSFFGGDNPKPLPPENSDYNSTVPSAQSGGGGSAPKVVPARR